MAWTTGVGSVRTVCRAAICPCHAPAGGIPFFVAALKDVAPERRTRVVLRELGVALVVMITFLPVGEPLLGLLHVSGSALNISGGAILFLIALRMVFPAPERSLQEEIAGEPFVVPLAIPYLAGPSLLATELLLVTQEPTRWVEWLIALVAAWLVTSAILLLGSKLSVLRGPRGLIAMARLTGMVLVAIAVQMFLTGVKLFVRGLAESSHEP